MEAPLITTIIPTFRRPALLRRAIASVLGQTFANFQVRVYDNASGDETAEIVAQFARRDSRVEYHCHAENIGASANFNYGLARVDTPYFSFLSDDDILLPEFYETTLAGYRRFPDAGFVAGSVIVMSDAGEVLAVPLEEWPREGFFSAPEGLLDLIDHKLPVWTSILFRKAATDPVGGLDEEVGGAADFDYQMRIACRSGFAVSRKACGIFVSHADSYTGNLKFSTFWPGWLKMAGNIAADPALPQPIRDGARRGLVRYITTTLFSIGLKLARAGNCPDARRAASVLREHFGERVRALALAAVASMCAAGSVQARCYAAAYDSARSLRRVLGPRRVQLEERYGRLRKWLGTTG
jgi:glycosyltransferase involved in cell wall biosynthesis